MTTIAPIPNSLDTRRIEPDAHGQAALLLAESTLHTLVERRAITNADAIAIVRSAAEVKVEVAEAAGESDKRMRESLALLGEIESSFEADRVVSGPRRV